MKSVVFTPKNLMSQLLLKLSVLRKLNQRVKLQKVIVNKFTITFPGVVVKWEHTSLAREHEQVRFLPTPQHISYQIT